MAANSTADADANLVGKGEKDEQVKGKNNESDQLPVSTSHEQDIVAEGSKSQQQQQDIEMGSRTTLREKDIEVEGRVSQCQDDEDQQIRLIPYVGMEFTTHEEAYEFYNLYARSKGFAVRKHSTRKSRKTKQVVSRNYVCAKQGTKKENENAKFHRGDFRTDCRANVWIILDQPSGSWKVKSFTDEHNHDLDTRESVTNYLSHTTLHERKDVKDLIGSLYTEGLKPAAIARVINRVYGNSEQTVTLRDCADEIRKGRQNNTLKKWKARARTRTSVGNFLLNRERIDESNATEVTQLMKYTLAAKVNLMINRACSSIQLYNNVSNWLDAKLYHPMLEKNNERPESSAAIQNSRTMAQGRMEAINLNVRSPPERARQKGRPRKMARIMNQDEVSKTQEIEKENNMRGNGKEKGTQ